MATLTTTFTPQARLTYVGLYSIFHRPRRRLSTSPRHADPGTYHRSDFTSHGFTGTYDPSAPVSGPLNSTSNIGAPRITPKLLAAHLDQFVVGQERAKRTLATAVYNHYQRIQELQRRDEQDEERAAQEERRRHMHRHPVEGRESELKSGIVVPSLTRGWDQDEFPGQQATVTFNAWSGADQRGQAQQSQHAREEARQQPSPPILDHSPLTIEKSNVLLLGPSGVGKTLMAKTLARVLEVPFSMSDCTPFTQAGYIGEDAEVCVQRLLAAANYDVARAERGIICLDEIDKIATAKVSHGKDVSGEGVQQALLKIIEGTTLQIQAKQERGSGGGSPSKSSSQQSQGYGPTNSPLSPGNISQSSNSSNAPQKGEVYNVKTDNILFICAGAFNGLHKVIMDRVSKGSMGFGAAIRARPGPSASTSHHETILEGEDELFEQHLPYYTSPASHSPDSKPPKRTFNTLDLVQPQDLQSFGLIPELVGRIPLSVALSSLDTAALVKVLTEPRNSLLKQYEQLLHLSSIELRITTPALHAIAESASKMGTGARALRTVMERLLAEPMFEAPGSGIRYVVITEAVASKKCGALYFGRGQQGDVTRVVAEEEEAWERRQRGESEWEGRARNNREGGAARTFEEYRVKASAGGY